MKINVADLAAWVFIGLGCFLAVLLFALAVLAVFRGRAIITKVRESWERGQMRTPDGQFKMAPTLDEARRFAGARGEPAYTAPPVILPEGYEDAIDESARVKSDPMLRQLPGIKPPAGLTLPPEMIFNRIK